MMKIDTFLLTMAAGLTIAACAAPRPGAAEYLVCDGALVLEKRADVRAWFTYSNGEYVLERGAGVIGTYTPKRGEACQVTPTRPPLTAATQPDTITSYD